MLTFLLFRRVFKWIFRLILAFIAISLLWVVSYRFFNPPTTALIQSREREYGTEALQVWVDYDQISDNLKLAVICGEDQRDRKSTRLNSSHIPLSRMPSSA